MVIRSKRTASTLFLCLVMLTLGSSGCFAGSAERIAFYDQTLKAANQRVADAESQIALLQTSLATARAAFDNPALPTDQRQAVQATIDKYAGDLVKAQQLRTIAAAVAAETQIAVEKAKAAPSVGAEVDIVTALLQAVTSRLGPTASAWGSVAVIVLGIIATVLKSRNANRLKSQLDATQDELAIHQQTLSAVVKGVENAPEAEAKIVKVAIKETMKDKRLLNQANEVIDQIKAA
jgi:hypothetical protein